MATIVQSFASVKRDLSSLFDPDLLAKACADAEHRFRDRVLTPARTLSAFATQIVNGNTAISHVVRLCGGTFGEAAYCRARKRLPLAVFRNMFRALTDKLAPEARATAGLWKGLRTFGLDGAACHMPDEPCLQEHFGQSNQQKAGLGFPITNILPLFDMKTGVLVDMIISPFAANDLSKTPGLHLHLGEGDVLVGDRGFAAYVHFSLLSMLGAHLLVRANVGRKIPYPASTVRGDKYVYNRHHHKVPLLVTMISDTDQVVSLAKPHNRPNWMTKEQFAQIPSSQNLRVLKFQVGHLGCRCTQIELMTTLLDPIKYPAADLAELYLARWRIEVNIRYLKTTMKMDSLRCKTVDGVTKELLMFAIVYNATCAVMNQAAKAQGVSVNRISFVDALRWLMTAPPGAPLPKLKVNQDPATRKIKSHPRKVKRRGKHGLLTLSRQAWRKRNLPDIAK